MAISVEVVERSTRWEDTFEEEEGKERAAELVWRA